MGMPSINILFETAARTAVDYNASGTVAVIVRDATSSEDLLGGHTLTRATDIPTGLSADNQLYIARAFYGATVAPSKVLLFVLHDDTDDDDDGDIDDALAWLATQSFDWVCAPMDGDSDDCEAIADWIADQRANYKAIYKAVLPNYAGASEAIVNFATSGILVAGTTYSAAAYCSRIAGLLAATSMTISATYTQLPEVEDVDRLTASEMDTAVDAGKFILFYDGSTVKCGRAVNSLVTPSSTQSDAYKKIKVVTIMDFIQSNLRSLFATNWIGKYGNSYDTKLLLVTAVKSFLTELESAGILNAGSTVSIDVDAQADWLTANGYAISDMTEQEILEHTTGSEVFLAVTISILDAMEDITVVINL